MQSVKYVFAQLDVATRNPNTRSGRCPHPQYAFSSLPCSEEGNDAVCPSNYKCCPLTDGMKCFAPCSDLAEPCLLQCEFGFKVQISPCTTCECAENPCLTRRCPLGTTCRPKMYEPCAEEGRCGFTTECIRDPMNETDPIVKPDNCPDYWPQLMSGTDGLLGCVGSDGLCPGKQKCCQAPAADSRFPGSSGPIDSETPNNYCVDPCKSIESCTLTCKYGLRIVGGCRTCECNSDPCATVKCAPPAQCIALPTPCFHYPGSLPCPFVGVCM